jgi:hypothetical protein
LSFRISTAKSRLLWAHELTHIVRGHQELGVNGFAQILRSITLDLVLVAKQNASAVMAEVNKRSIAHRSASEVLARPRKVREMARIRSHNRSLPPVITSCAKFV